jgi:hypothetical protein
MVFTYKSPQSAKSFTHYIEGREAPREALSETQLFSVLKYIFKSMNWLCCSSVRRLMLSRKSGSVQGFCMFELLEKLM